MAAGGGHIGAGQSLRGLVQNTEPHVVGSVPDGTMRSAPASASFETRPPSCGSISRTTSPNVNRYRPEAMVGVTGLATPPSGAPPPAPPVAVDPPAPTAPPAPAVAPPAPAAAPPAPVVPLPPAPVVPLPPA